MRASLATLSKSLLRAHISPTPPVLAAVAEPHPTLPQLLASLPGAGVGATVRQRRWAAKGLDVPVDEPLKGPVSREERESREPLCYWLVTRTQLKDGGRHGKAWGRLVWRGEWRGEGRRG